MNRRVTIACVAGVCMLLSGCGSETNRAAATDNTPPAEEVTTAAEPALPEPITLKVDLFAERAALDGLCPGIACVAFSPDAKTLAVAGMEHGGRAPNAGLVKLLELPSGREIATLRDRGEIWAVAFSPDGKTMVTASRSGVKLWDVATAEQLAALPQKDVCFDAVPTMTLSADGRLLAISGKSRIDLWDLPARKLRWSVRAFIGGALAFSPDGKILASACGDFVLLWDVDTGLQLAEQHGGQYNMGRQVLSAAFAPTGSILATAFPGGTKLWEVQTKPDGVVLRERAELPGQAVFIRERDLLAFSPDGKLLATIDGTVRLWDVATARQLATPDRSGGRCVAFSPDGETLAVGGTDRAGDDAVAVVTLWNVAAALDPRVVAAQAKKAHSDLIQARKDGDVAAMCNAMTAIGPYAEEAVPVLIDALKDPSVADRGRIAYLLSRIAPKAKDLMPALIEAMKDESRGVRGWAIAALGQLGPEAKAAVPELIEALGDREYLGLSAELTLAKIGPEAIPEILKALEDDKIKVATKKIKVATKIGPETIPKRLKALEDDKSRVGTWEVYQVFRLLFRFFGEAAVPAMRDALKHENPAVRHLAAEVLRRLEITQRQKHLRKIRMAMHNYHCVHGAFPPAASRDQHGKPLLSWRVQLLPHLGEQALYEKFRLDEPWDGPHNVGLIEQMPEVFRASGRANDGKTTLMVFVGRGTPFGGQKGPRIEDIRDATSRMVMVVEAGAERAVPWTRPADLAFDPEDPAAVLGEAPEGGRWAAFFFDARPRVIRKDIDAQTLRAWISLEGGEPVDRSRRPSATHPSK